MQTLAISKKKRIRVVAFSQGGEELAAVCGDGSAPTPSRPDESGVIDPAFATGTTAGKPAPAGNPVLVPCCES